MSNAIPLETSPQLASDFDEPPVTDVFRTARATTDTVPSETPQTEIEVLSELTYRDARARALAAFERTYVHALLQRGGGNVSHCARLAGLDRVYLHRLIRRYDLRGTQRTPRPLKPTIFRAAE